MAPVAVDDLGALRGVERAGGADARRSRRRGPGTSCGASMPVARVEHVGAADEQVGGRRRCARVGARVAVMRAAAPARGAGRASARAGEQLVEHRHAHDDAGLDLAW